MDRGNDHASYRSGARSCAFPFPTGASGQNPLARHAWCATPLIDITRTVEGWCVLPALLSAGGKPEVDTRSGRVVNVETDRIIALKRLVRAPAMSRVPVESGSTTANPDPIPLLPIAP